LPRKKSIRFGLGVLFFVKPFFDEYLNHVQVVGMF
jgi:hypothetical protein